jgi:endonuclease/exonuclease/phosphatase family metal-dependent hydrolase
MRSGLLALPGCASFALTGCVSFALVGCVSVIDEAGPWEPASSITGELAPEFGPPPADAPVPSTLRIASWNVHYGENVETLATNIRASALADVDLWFLQEIESDVDEPGTRTRRLAEGLGLTWVYAPSRTTDNGTHGIALLSRFPLDNVEIRRLPFIDQPIRARRRNAIAAELVFGERRIRLVDLHLDVRLGAADRIRQLDPAVIDFVDDLPTVIGGDFNTNPWAWVEAAVPLTGTEAIVGMEQAVVVDDYMTGLGFTGSVDKDTGTVRVPGVSIRADNIYTRAITFADAGLEEIDGSDHWPVWIDLAFD